MASPFLTNQINILVPVELIMFTYHAYLLG